jgi:outer membrane receptor protein involved in Fe transport
MAEGHVKGFTARVLYNFIDDRISDVGANEAPDIIEQGRGAVDLVLSQRVKSLILRLALENLTDSRYLFTQGVEDQRVFRLGRTIAFSLGYNVF